MVLRRDKQSRFAQLLRKCRNWLSFRCGNQLVNRAVHEIDEVQLSGVIFAEGDDPERSVHEFLLHRDRFAVVAQRGDLAGVVVAVDVSARKVLALRAAVDEAAGHRTKIGMRMFDDRLENRRGSLFAIGTEGMRTFVDAPAVIAATFDFVDRFPQILADFARPEVAGLPIKTELPRLTESIRPQLRPRARRLDQRVVLWNAVIAAGIRMIDVDANDAGEEVANVLSGLELVGNAAAVAARKVKVSVLSKRQAAGVVSAGRPFENHLFRFGVAAPGALFADLKPGNSAPFGHGLLVVDHISYEDVTVLLKFRME